MNVNIDNINDFFCRSSSAFPGMLGYNMIYLHALGYMLGTWCFKLGHVDFHDPEGLSYPFQTAPFLNLKAPKESTNQIVK